MVEVCMISFTPMTLRSYANSFPLMTLSHREEFLISRVRIASAYYTAVLRLSSSCEAGMLVFLMLDDLSGPC